MKPLRLLPAFLVLGFFACGNQIDVGGGATAPESDSGTAPETGTGSDGSIPTRDDDAGDEGVRPPVASDAGDASDATLPRTDGGVDDGGEPDAASNCASVTETFDDADWTPAIHNWMPGGADVHPIPVALGGTAAPFTFNSTVSVLARKHDPTCAFSMTMKLVVNPGSAGVAQDVISLDFSSQYHFRIGIGVSGLYYVTSGGNGYSGTPVIGVPGGWGTTLHTLVVTATTDGAVGFTLDQDVRGPGILSGVGGVETITVGNITANSTNMFITFDNIVIQ